MLILARIFTVALRKTGSIMSIETQPSRDCHWTISATERSYIVSYTENSVTVKIFADHFKLYTV